MNLEEKLEGINTKELIYIFLSIPIVVFIFYYNFVYPKLEKTNKKLLKTEKAQKKELIKTSSEIRKVKNSRNILTPTRERLEDLRESFKYISYNFDSLDLIKLNDRKIYLLLTKMLNKANNLNLNVSFGIEWNNKKYPPFTQYVSISITGSGNYSAIIRYFQFLDHLRALINIDTAKISIDLQAGSNIVKSLVEKKKAESSTISFLLTKYSESTIRYFKGMARSSKLKISISVYDLNPNYLSISFSGDYAGIDAIFRTLQNVSKQKNKPYEFTRLKVNLKKVKTGKDGLKKQQFIVNLQIVGVK